MQPEHTLQSKCVIWFSQQFPGRRGALFATFSSQGAAEASQKLSLGLVRALPDLIYIHSGKLVGIELKAHGSKHDVKHIREQCEWLMKFPESGCFCDSLEMFQNIITASAAYVGISPYEVFEKLKTVTTKTVDWDKLVEGL